MTNKEAINLLTQVNKILVNSNSWLENTHEPLNMAFDMAIKALEQEPCEDAISRETVVKYIKEKCNPYGKPSIDFEAGKKAIEYFKALSPVQPKPKTGHCKDCKWWKDSDGVYRRGVEAESRCPINHRKVFEGIGYCYMFEPQESEDNA